MSIDAQIESELDKYIPDFLGSQELRLMQDEGKEGEVEFIREARSRIKAQILAKIEILNASDEFQKALIGLRKLEKYRSAYEFNRLQINVLIICALHLNKNLEAWESEKSKIKESKEKTEALLKSTRKSISLFQDIEFSLFPIVGPNFRSDCGNIHVVYDEEPSQVLRNLKELEEDLERRMVEFSSTEAIGNHFAIKNKFGALFFPEGINKQVEPKYLDQNSLIFSLVILFRNYSEVSITDWSSFFEMEMPDYGKPHFPVVRSLVNVVVNLKEGKDSDEMHEEQISIESIKDRIKNLKKNKAQGIAFLA